MMSAAMRDSTGSGSLNLRIRRAEQQLADRQESIGLHAVALRRKLRESLGSPITLLVAAGAGFAIGKFSKRKHAQRQAEGGTAIARPSFFATVMDALTLASTVMAILPAMRREPVRNPDAMDDRP